MAPAIINHKELVKWTVKATLCVYQITLRKKVQKDDDGERVMLKTHNKLHNDISGIPSNPNYAKLYNLGQKCALRRMPRVKFFCRLKCQVKAIQARSTFLSFSRLNFCDTQLNVRKSEKKEFPFPSRMSN